MNTKLIGLGILGVAIYYFFIRMPTVDPTTAGSKVDQLDPNTRAALNAIASSTSSGGK